MLQIDTPAYSSYYDSIISILEYIMKAMVYEKYGPPEVLHLKEVEKPFPKDNEVLIKIYATTVAAEDPRWRSFTFPAWAWLMLRMQLGIIRPRQKILGFELAGEIDEVGKDVKWFKKGDQVIGHTAGGGTNAEYKCMPEEKVLAIKPTNITYEEAATIPGGAISALLFRISLSFFISFRKVRFC